MVMPRCGVRSRCRRDVRHLSRNRLPIRDLSVTHIPSHDPAHQPGPALGDAGPGRWAANVRHRTHRVRRRPYAINDPRVPASHRRPHRRVQQVGRSHADNPDPPPLDPHVARSASSPTRCEGPYGLCHLGLSAVPERFPRIGPGSSSPDRRTGGAGLTTTSRPTAAEAYVTICEFWSTAVR